MHQALHLLFLSLAAALLLCACDDDSKDPVVEDTATETGEDTGTEDTHPEEDATPEDSMEDQNEVADSPEDDSAEPPDCITESLDFPALIHMPNEDTNGSYDPSLERDPSTGRLWMAYSGVEGPPGSGKVSTHLAYSDDQGLTWCYQALVNPSLEVAREDQPTDIAQDHAHWSHETASLVYDPAAPEETRWTLMWMRYLHIEDNIPGNEDRHFEHGWIAARSASTPEDLVHAPERKLFSNLAYHYSPVVEAYNDAAVGGLPEKRWDSDPDLGGCLAFAEPGALAYDGALYVALFCARSPERAEINLVRYDHSTQAWSYMNTFLPSDQPYDDYPNLLFFNGPDLSLAGGEPRLLITPVIEGYQGCLSYPINLNEGTLAQAPTYTLEPTPGADIYQSGPCTYEEGSALGVLSGDVFLSTLRFDLIATGDTLP